jgi:hypothetical protein
MKICFPRPIVVQYNKVILIARAKGYLKIRKCISEIRGRERKLTMAARQSQSSHQDLGIFPPGLLTHRDQKRKATATIGIIIEGIISWTSS